MIIAVDFDGTIVQHKFPEIGEPIDRAFKTLKQWQLEGHKLILWTCRNDTDPALNGRKVLTEAVDFCKANGLVFDAVNENLKDLRICPVPKIYADTYIDDRNIDQMGFVSWSLFEGLLTDVMRRNKPFKYSNNELRTTVGR